MTKSIGELTAWAEINPTMALAPQPEQRLACSAALTPATSEQFRNELTSCLALTAPAGMTEEARREWLLVAWETLKHLPSDILASGCRKARQICDHPSKIVPAIIAETDEWMRLRQSSQRNVVEVAALPAPSVKHVMERRGEPMSEEDTAELNRILEYQGATARYRPDGSRYFMDRNG